jgi:hypothetical protein
MARGDVPVPLGGAFHSRRLTLRGSQVGTMPPARAALDLSAPLEKALRLLADPALEAS